MSQYVLIKSIPLWLPGKLRQ